MSQLRQQESDEGKKMISYSVNFLNKIISIQLKHGTRCCTHFSSSKVTKKPIYLLFTVRDVADAAPRKGLVRVEFAVGAVDVKTLSIHSK